MGSVDLVLKAACEGCGSSSDLYGTACKHTTLCSSCGKSMALSRARCLICSAPIANLIREYNVRATATTDKSFSIARFVTGLPPFSKKKSAENKWPLHKEGLQGRQLTENMRYQGQMEGSQSAIATYYLLMMHGKEFHAYPAGSWYNFSKIAQYKQLTLEEAEEKMSKRKTSATGYERWMMKAATNGPAAFGSDVKKLEVTNGMEKESARPKKGKNNEGNNSDKGEEDEEEAARKNRLGLNKKSLDDDEEGGNDLDFDLDDEIEKGDDWEHEETLTDDDEAIQNENVPLLSDDEENEEGGLSKSGKELKKLLGRAAGLNESDAEEEEEEDDDDDETSPVLAPKKKDQPKDEHVDNSPAKPTPSGHARGTPPASKSKQKRKSSGDDTKASGGSASKKAKVESDTKTSAAIEEAPSSSKPASKVIASSKSGTNVSPVTEDEIRTVLLAVAPVTTQDLVSRFKSRLRGPERPAAPPSASRWCPAAAPLVSASLPPQLAARWPCAPATPLRCPHYAPACHAPRRAVARAMLCPYPCATARAPATRPCPCTMPCPCCTPHPCYMPHPCHAPLPVPLSRAAARVLAALPYRVPLPTC
ncbi:hypothetical protein ABZP36_011627, partial [Zizania latifolia]